MVDSMNLLLAGDAACVAVLPTIINSVLTYTERDVWVKVLCRGWTSKSFENGRVKVDFISCNEGLDTPLAQFSSINDRMLTLDSITEWDRCLFLEWDQLVVAPIDSFYDMEFGAGEVTTGVLYHKQIRDLKFCSELHMEIGVAFSEEALDMEAFYGGSHLFDMKKHRELGLSDIIREKLPRMQYEDHATALCIYGDKLKVIDKELNLFTKDTPNHTGKILHFWGIPKPWEDGAKQPVWEIFKTTWQELRHG